MSFKIVILLSFFMILNEDFNQINFFSGFKTKNMQ